MTNEELVKQIQQGVNTTENMELLYMQNKGLIYMAVKRYRYACQSDRNSTPIIEMDELMHEAYFGLIKAVETYVPDKDILFMSYAPKVIRQVVKRYLENCGRVVRVPVHTQAKIYQYNRLTTHFLQQFNREPTIQEYARWLEISEKGADQLQCFMFQDKVKSLDVALPGSESEDTTIGDTLASDTDIEGDVVEQITQEQLHQELWDLVSQVLKDDKKVQILKWRYIDNFTLEEIANRYKVSGANIRQFEVQSLRRLRSNSKTKRIGIELGLWEKDSRISASKIKEWVGRGHINWLNQRELEYAKRMGWIINEV